MEYPKNKYQIDITSSDTYHKFYKKVDKNVVAKNVFTSALKDFYTAMVNDVILKDKIFNVPEGFGAIYVRWRYPKVEIDPETYRVISNNAPVDWKETNAYWKDNPEAKANKVLIRHDNPNTSGKIGAIAWTKKASNFSGINVFRFVGARSFKRRMAQMIKNGELW